MADLVTKCAAIDAILNAHPHGKRQTYIRLIGELPTIDAVPVVHARWIKGKYMNDVYGYENTCSHCRQEYVMVFDYLYCPYCGSKMDGGMKDEG